MNDDVKNAIAAVVDLAFMEINAIIEKASSQGFMVEIDVTSPPGQVGDGTRPTSLVVTRIVGRLLIAGRAN